MDVATARRVYAFLARRRVSVHALALSATPLVPLPLHEELAREGGLLWLYMLDARHLPLQSLWRAVCDGRTPRGQDRGWFLSAFCGRAAGDELEYIPLQHPLTTPPYNTPLQHPLTTPPYNTPLRHPLTTPP